MTATITTSASPLIRGTEPTRRSVRPCSRAADGDVAADVVVGRPMATYRRPITDERLRRHHGDQRSGGVAGQPRPNYVARRVVAGVAALLIAVGCVSGAGAIVASFGGSPASAAEAQPVTSSAIDRFHVAQPGDTLWSIATEHHGSIDLGRYVDALIDRNGGTRIEVGQAVRLP